MMEFCHILSICRQQSDGKASGASELEEQKEKARISWTLDP